MSTSNVVLQVQYASIFSASCRFFIVTAFVGLNSLLISVLLPIFFYLRLHRRLSGPRAAALYALLALSVVLSVVIGYLDIAQYIASLSGEVDPSDPV